MTSRERGEFIEFVVFVLVLAALFLVLAGVREGWLIP